MDEYPIVLRRRERRNENDWLKAKNWFGGLPRISPDQWPRDPATDIPLHFLAWIDLSDLPAGQWPTGLPENGALAFFCDTDFDGRVGASRVIFEPEPTRFPPCEPPEGTPPLYGEEASHYHFPEFENLDVAPRHFNRWPIELIREGPVNREAGEVGRYFHVSKLDNAPPAWEAVRRLCRQFGQQLERWSGYHDALPRRDRQKLMSYRTPYMFDFARAKLGRLLQRLRGKVDFSMGGQTYRIYNTHRWETSLEERDRALMDLRYHERGRAEFFLARPEVEDVLSRLAAAAAENERWQRIPATLHDKILSFLREAKIARICDTDLRDSWRRCVIDMATMPREVFDRLSPELKDGIARTCAPDWAKFYRHQIFGTGLNIQGAVDENRGQVMLLQLSSDQMLRWEWGDAGVLQFWISLDDLGEQRFDRCYMTMEGH